MAKNFIDQRLAAVKGMQIDLRLCVAVAAAIALAFTLMGLAAPPGLFSDAGNGFLVLRSYLAGAPYNTQLLPDAANIAADASFFQTWWSPGQYTVPGLFHILGLKLGYAITITNGLASACGLVGWAVLMHRFELPKAATLTVVVFIGLARHFSVSFGIYTGGEVLLFAGLPWALMGAWIVPRSSFLTAFVLTAVMVAVLFFFKLTGLVVAASALAAASLLRLVETRRISAGMIGGALGAGLVLGVLYWLWFSRGGSPGVGGEVAVTWRHAVFPLLAPWASAVSYGDLLQYVLLNPGRPVFPDLDSLTLLYLPPAVFFGWMLLRFGKAASGRQTPALAYLAAFAALYCLLLLVMYLRGGNISLEERHLRPAGLALFVCVAVAALDAVTPKIARYAFIAACSCLAAYGLMSAANRTLSTVRADAVDSFSATNQPGYSPQALAQLRAIYAAHGKAAVFVLPNPNLAVTLPSAARTIAVNVDFTPEAALQQMKFQGRAAGPLVVLLPVDLARSRKAELLKAAFVNYAATEWSQKAFGDTVVMVTADR